MNIELYTLEQMLLEHQKTWNCSLTEAKAQGQCRLVRVLENQLATLELVLAELHKIARDTKVTRDKKQLGLNLVDWIAKVSTYPLEMKDDRVVYLLGVGGDDFHDYKQAAIGLLAKGEHNGSGIGAHALLGSMLSHVRRSLRRIAL